MRTIWIAGFALLIVSALFVTNALGATGTPQLKALVWLDAVNYGNGETATIKFLVTVPAQVTLTIAKPDGTTVNFGPLPAQAGTVMTQQVQSSTPSGTRQVTLTATAGQQSATATTSYQATGGLAQALVGPNAGQGQNNNQGQQTPDQAQGLVGEQGQTGDQGLAGDQGQMPPADQGQGFADDQGQNGDIGQPLTTG
ncbi:MAG: hypothetical protein ACE14P_13650 [Methanotrichaceae archaeon]